LFVNMEVAGGGKSRRELPGRLIVGGLGVGRYCGVTIFREGSGGPCI